MWVPVGRFSEVCFQDDFMEGSGDENREIWDPNGTPVGREKVVFFGTLFSVDFRRIQAASGGTGEAVQLGGGILTDPALSGFVCRFPRPASVPD